MTDADHLKEIGRLRAALRPFAECAEDLDETDKDLWALWDHPAGLNVTIKDIRAAKRAYEAKL